MKGKWRFFFGLCALGGLIEAWLFSIMLDQPPGGGPTAGLIVLLPIAGAIAVAGFLGVAALILRFAPEPWGLGVVAIGALVALVSFWVGFAGPYLDHEDFMDSLRAETRQREELAALGKDPERAQDIAARWSHFDQLSVNDRQGLIQAITNLRARGAFAVPRLVRECRGTHFYATEALAAIGAEALPDLEAMVKSGEFEVRQCALEALKKFSWFDGNDLTRPNQLIAGMVNDPSEWIRSAAQEHMQTQGRRAP